MYSKAIITYLKAHASIPDVYPIGGYSKSTNTGGMKKPYVLVYETPKSSRYNSQTNNGVVSITIMTAFPPNYQDALDQFVMFELFALLDGVRLDIVNGLTTSHVIVDVTDRISQIITDTSDGYIAKERIVTMPYRWR